MAAVEGRVVRSRWFGGLWQHPDFVKLWISETVSLFGSEITLLALPLTAVLTLDASAGQMGVLVAAERAPFLLVGLLAGVWVDRMRRRPVLMWANVGRSLLLATIPLAALLAMLTMVQLYVVGFLVGVLTVFFDVAYQSYLPSLVPTDRLAEGNGKLEMSRSAAQIAGPGVAGGLVSLLTAPIAILFDALSFGMSALFLSRIRKSEPELTKPVERPSLRTEILEGLGLVLRNPLLRPIAGSTATSNLFGSVSTAVLVLYATQRLEIGPGLLGGIFAVGSVDALLGAFLSGWIVRLLGLGRAIVAAILVAELGWGLVALAAAPGWLSIVLFVAAVFVGGFGSVVYNVNQVSLRQAITPDQLQGRMNATMRFLVWGTMPLGALLGGALGEGIGLRPTLVVAAVGGQFAVLWVLFSPVRSLRELPSPARRSDGPV